MDDIRREYNQVKLKLGKAVASVEDMYAEKEVIKIKSERRIAEVEGEKERERRMMERVIKEL